MGSNKSWLAILLGTAYALFSPSAIFAQQTETDSTRLRLPDSLPIVQRIGIDLRPTYIAPTHEFLRGANNKQHALRKAFSAHLKWAFQFHPFSETGSIYPHTYQGIGLSYNSFESAQEIGSPTALYVFQGSRIARLGHNLSLNYEWNFGAAFGWNPYDPYDNVNNRVIGSKVNAYLNVGFFVDWKLSPHWSMNAGADLTHYSNGNTKFPNSGLNLIGGRIGLVYTPNPVIPERVAGQSATIPMSGFREHISYDVVVYGAWKRKGVFIDGQGYLAPGTFAVAGFNFNPMYNFSHRLKAGLSLDFQYDESANIEQWIATPETPDDLKFYRPPFRQQAGLGLSVRGEYVMPIFAINLGIGGNFIRNGKDLKGLYQILALKCSLTRNVFLHVGYQLRDFHTPNNLMLGLGYRFHNLRRTH